MSEARPRGRPIPRRRRGVLDSLIYWGTVALVWVLIAGAATILIFAQGLPDTSKLTAIQRQPSISYLDRSGALLAVRGSQYAPPVDLASLPAYVPGAFIAIEDKNFYHHMGFSPTGIVRSLIYNATHHGGPLRGGSTITQQLARNLFLTPKQDFKRKIQELILSVELEWRFSKSQILALYLNRVSFGSGAYGIEAASQRYFAKPAKDLSIGEAALLAGLLRAPSRYNPVADPDRAADRTKIVLDRMVETRVITRQQEDEVFQHPLVYNKQLASQHAQYFVDWVDAQVRRIIGDRQAQDQRDLIVETTLDLPIDAAAETAVRQGVAEAKAQGVQQSALVALDGEGRVRALIGGTDYAATPFDRAVQSRRQAGSTWKPFVYLTAVEAGRTPDTQVVDEPVTIAGWTPHNYTNRYLGPITLQTALSQSINTIAARLADEVGRQNVARTAERLGITSPINTDPAMALGTSEVSPLEMAQAYGAFADGGRAVRAYGIERIRTADGTVVYEHHPDDARQVINNPPLAYMDQMLRAVMRPPGTGAGAALPGYDLAGKTGTTSDYRDAWFIGFTGGFVTAVWTGRDDNSPMRKVTGGGAPAHIWKAFMAAALPRLAVGPIPAGPNPPPATAPVDDPVADLLNRTGENGEGATLPDAGAAPDDGAPARSDDPPG
ncbi:MAG: PBP1A family penicillin-binding protein [Caulobacteraceae bacterium]|nr:PBP1A family penicillin-binding protein [Caulobacter sp.]